MKERPILFSAPMVRALLAGMKTQTRRALSERARIGYPHSEIARACPTSFETTGGLGFGLRCPYGVVGDRLWVRETFKATGLFANKKPRDTRACARFAYAADVEQLGRDALIKWRPGIHMPRWASRITLEVTEVRVQRLRDISDVDVLAEGVDGSGMSVDRTGLTRGRGFGSIGEAYFSLWDSINGDGAAKKNPWVWAISFKRVDVHDASTSMGGVP